ncbi:MAG: hypothetical protein OEQ39_23220 [Gammaproteobacteria bacterium]|nr:hypothetical protein [Gammaproteobacteria bacterium]MDH3379845.1 hypothetical protein [Gammaproteobacteria bacterium]
MNRHDQHHIRSYRSGFNLTGRCLFGFVLGGLLLISGCASTQSNRSSCPATPDTVSATQSQADAGEAASQYQVGSWYRYWGGCLKHDQAKAVEWFRRAAERGHADAQYELGQMFYYGYGIEQDGEEAARWFRQAAEQGHSQAARRLGDLYTDFFVNDSRFARDPDRAEYWYRRAFAGNALSQAAFDRRLEYLEKIRDPAAWEREQRLAEERKQEQQRVAKERKQEQQRVAKEQRQEQQRLAEERKQEQQRLAEERKRDPAAWKRKQQRLAEEGDPRAQYKLGEFYIAASNDGKSVQAWADTVSSDTLIGDWGGWFNSSSGSGEIKLRITENDNENYTGHVLKIPEGIYSLTCKGAPIKLNRGGENRYAVSFNRRNVCQGKGAFGYTGQTLKGEVLFEGWRSPVAISLTRLGRNISNVQTLAADNDQVERNFTLAAPWFQKSAGQGYADAQFVLGLMYEAGIGGISKDIDKAKGLYQKAADQEHVLAKRQLCELSDDCAPTPIPTGKSASGSSEGWILLCLVPYIFQLCLIGAMAAG